jgi:hypothetical protein
MLGGYLKIQGQLSYFYSNGKNEPNIKLFLVIFIQMEKIH